MQYNRHVFKHKTFSIILVSWIFRSSSFTPGVELSIFGNGFLKYEQEKNNDTFLSIPEEQKLQEDVGVAQYLAAWSLL